MHVYSSGHIHSLTVCAAFAAGAGAPLHVNARALLPGPMFTYGNLRGLKELLDAARADGRDWYYGDNGYFRPGHYAGYYRVTKNAEQHDGRGAAGPARWERLDKKIFPWKKGGRSIMICPPGEKYAELHGFSAARWLADVETVLARHTDRPRVVRSKPPEGAERTTLWSALKDCHAVVTHSSNSAVEALLFGVPVFCTGACAAATLASADVSTIEKPLYPDGREQWAWNLAAAQWTLDEMRDGTCWKDLHRD